MKEVWKPIKNKPNYEVSNFGNVRVKLYKTLKQEQINNKYLRISIEKKTLYCSSFSCGSVYT